MPIPEETRLETSKSTTDRIDQVHAAIDPAGGVKKIMETPADPVAIVEKLETAIDPSGGVKKADLF